MKQWSDSVKALQMNTIVDLDGLVAIREGQIDNLKTQNEFEREKFDLAEQDAKNQRGWKRFWMVATGLTAGFLALALL
jgi:hypothetical protein